MSAKDHQDLLAPPHSQLPPNAYFDPSLLEQELTRLFDPGPHYVGHELMIPELGDYATVKAEADGRVLVRNPNGPALLSNVCRHRQAIMLRDRGNVENIVCPLHRWTYSLDGALLGAPQFTSQPDACLAQYPLQNWRGLLFAGGRNIAADLAAVGAEDLINFDGYRLDHIEMHQCDYNWKTFIEVYLEDYHVGPFHPGLGQFVSCDDLQWQFGDQFSIQTVGIHEDLQKPGTDTYRRWHEQVLDRNGGKVPRYGAIWMTYYPNIMVEWYPDVLVVSTLIPTGPQQTLNVVEFYYPEEISLFERTFVEAERAAYMETAVEDDEIARRMDEGRLALLKRGAVETGPYQSPMEDGMQHFHEYLRRHLTLDPA
ncbi:MAG: aromatic ring-hydroxylating dioxygenase subunit alpha [Burkholderiaceae bacterium]